MPKASAARGSIGRASYEAVRKHIDAGKKATAAFEAERRRKFEPAKAPLLRFAVHRLDEECFQFTWAEHHVILDGWSVAALLAELFQLYRREMGTEALPLAPPPGAAGAGAWTSAPPRG